MSAGPDRHELEEQAGAIEHAYRQALRGYALEVGIALLPCLLGAGGLAALRRQRSEARRALERADLEHAGHSVIAAVEPVIAELGIYRLELIDGWDPTLFWGARIVSRVPLEVNTDERARAWLAGMRLPGREDFTPEHTESQNPAEGPDEL